MWLLKDEFHPGIRFTYRTLIIPPQEIRRPCPSSSLGRAAPGTTLGVELCLQNQPLQRPNPSLQRPAALPPFVLQMPMAFPAVGDLHRACFSGSKTAAWPLQTLPCSVQWQMPMALFSGSNAQTLPSTVKWPLERLRANANGPFKPFPAASSGLSTCCLANANGFSSCRGSAQSSFFQFQDCRLASQRLLPGPFKPFPAASNGLSTCCLANANHFSSCRGSAQSFFFPSNPSLANASGFSSWRGSAQSSFFRFQDCRLAPSNPSLQRPVAFPPLVLQFQRPNPALQRQMAFGTVACKCQWPLQTLSSGKCQWLFQLSGICTSGFSSFRGSAQSPFFPVPSSLHRGSATFRRLPPGPFKPFPAASSGLATCCLAIFQIKCQWLFQFLQNQMPVAFPVGDLHRALFINATLAVSTTSPADPTINKGSAAPGR